MDKIICLVGASGSGKTTVAKELYDMGYNVIQSYTTRKPRHVGEWGHIFVNKGQEPLKRGRDGGKMIFFTKSNVIAYKELYNYSYWATKEQYQGKGTSVYVVDPCGAKQVKENVIDAEIITIFMMCDESTRIERMKEERGYDATIKRIKKDRKIFQTCKCDYVVDANQSVVDVVNNIIKIIGGLSNEI